jgi:hypothetical protein|tara:strand:+ start:1485 stop:1790 length:306 start_codon:yes stop_codon:yes gene_type:complete
LSTTQTGNLYTGHTREKYEEYMMRMMIEEDAVNHPQHYNQAGIECIDAIKAATDEGFEYYLQGNILKYLWRYRYKNGVEDLKKAQWYLEKLIKETEGNKDE